MIILYKKLIQSWGSVSVLSVNVIQEQPPQLCPFYELMSYQDDPTVTPTWR